MASPEQPRPIGTRPRGWGCNLSRGPPPARLVSRRLPPAGRRISCRGAIEAKGPRVLRCFTEEGRARLQTLRNQKGTRR